MSATIFAVHTTPSGAKRLPKVPSIQARVTRAGIEGDYNHFRHVRKKDTPDRALLLLTDDVLFALNKEGFSAHAGDLGENLLITGLPYAALESGQQYRIGADLVIEITEQCNPCRNLLKLPYGSAALLGALRDRRGWFAKVLKEGVVRAGDKIIISQY